jgi:hypothetical protein
MARRPHTESGSREVAETRKPILMTDEERLKARADASILTQVEIALF